MNQTITIKWWHPDCKSEIPETAKSELQTEATIHVHRMIDQGYTSGDLNCEAADGIRYRGSWELYSSDRNHLSRKIYGELYKLRRTTTEDVPIVTLSQVEDVLEKYLGKLW